MLQDYSKYSELNRVPVIDVPITGTNMSDCIDFLAEHINNLHGEYICVSNAHTSVMAHDDPSYWACQAESLMSVPDGKPLSVVGRKTVDSMDRVTGPDLMREIFEISSQYGWSHYFYGNEQKNLDALKQTLLRDYPNLNIAGMEPSVFRSLSEIEKAELSNRIADSGADFAWIALGAPRQEVLMHELKGGPQPLMIGVGGAFNVLAGVVPEAPIWMQNLSLEWLYRLIQEPKRLFKRYLVTNTKFLFYQFTGAKRKEGK
ncbi:WecB/TagA/CpsF family glycosyltransferase [Collinsella sp. AF20-14LB]|uniref:WecB/TagA/CpsF family glycosyltransferase n=1 Tax=Collinsella sp. AF20-14LB TaxID=2292221 RepID=UPI000E51DFD8|nr:WecB/TagA/CpsF family glycosyltransferase [Collinsella sp. AF20-14LB]RGS94474.1 glycosyltransferase [Collinsella sp. AF20-14LB]